MSPVTIFIVDDDTAVRNSLKFLLEAEGLESEDFASGSEFIGSGRPGKEDCIILDVQMPGMSGLDVLARLKREGSTSPVIIATSMPSPDTTMRAYTQGAFRVLDKPFDSDALLGAVHEALKEAHKPALNS
jgi:FixJ family two-component response regulator